MATLLVKLLQPGLHRGYVAHDAVVGQIRHHFLEGRNGVFHRHGIYQELRAKLLYLVQRRKPAAVVSKPHPNRVFFIHRHLVVEAQQIKEKAPHLAGSHNQNPHITYILMIDATPQYSPGMARAHTGAVTATPRCTIGTHQPEPLHGRCLLVNYLHLLP